MMELREGRRHVASGTDNLGTQWHAAYDCCMTGRWEKGSIERELACCAIHTGAAKIEMGDHA